MTAPEPPQVPLTPRPGEVVAPSFERQGGQAGSGAVEFAARLRLRRDRAQRAARLALLEEYLGGPPAPEVLERVRAVLHGPPASRAVG